jgi:tRNA threonylcarbamoyladenosine biosynthesis protein TsaB
MKPNGGLRMKILALEFSSPQRSVAIVQADASAGVVSLCEAVAAGVEGPKTFGLVERVLNDARLEREQIECLAIGLGPGSYAGIRAAIALAQGWQLARGVNLLGISSAECVAAQAQAEGIVGHANVVIDAQRNEFYLAGYVLADQSRSELEPLHLATLAEVQRHVDAGEAIIGPEVVRWFPQGRPILPRAGTLGRLALARTGFAAGEKLEPIYLRETSFVKAPPPRLIPSLDSNP